MLNVKETVYKMFLETVLMKMPRKWENWVETFLQERGRREVLYATSVPLLHPRLLPVPYHGVSPRSPCCLEYCHQMQTIKSSSIWG